jgi:hypothetical protein
MRALFSNIQVSIMILNHTTPKLKKEKTLRKCLKLGLFFNAALNIVKDWSVKRDPQNAYFKEFCALLSIGTNHYTCLPMSAFKEKTLCIKDNTGIHNFVKRSDFKKRNNKRRS